MTIATVWKRINKNCNSPENVQQELPQTGYIGLLSSFMAPFFSFFILQAYKPQDSILSFKPTNLRTLYFLKTCKPQDSILSFKPTKLRTLYFLLNLQTDSILSFKPTHLRTLYFL